MNGSAELRRRMNKTDKRIKARAQARRKEKTYKDDFWTVNSLFGNDWAKWFLLLGGREAGKSYAVMKWGVINKLKRPEDFKFYWFRLTDKQKQKLLLSGGDKFIDPDIADKYGIKTMSKGDTIYTYKEVERETKSGNVVTEKKDIKEFATVLSCSTFYNDKGIGYFDANYKGEYYIVLDEMNREQNEANRFDIVYAFCNQLENVLRSVHNRVRIICIGNTLDEASDILSAFNFIPDTFGRYKLKSKKAIVDYIAPNDKYKERRAQALSTQLIADSSTITNEVVIDRSLLVNYRKCVRPTSIIKFGKSTDKWFTVWDGNIIRQYKGEFQPGIAMVQYIDEFYDRELAQSVIRRFNARAFYYTEIATFKRFQKNLRLMKK